VTGQVEPLRLLERGKQQMEERSYQDALETFSTLTVHDHTLRPIVWQGGALKRLGRLSEAVKILREGLRCRGGADEKFRRAVVLWNLACYRALLNEGKLTPTFVESLIELLAEALENAPEFQESLATESPDRDLVSLLGNPVFERWRGEVLNGERGSYV
jgi:tetratricopeptide (TPR) repeat protein